jgi:hypothetical protein
MYRFISYQRKSHHTNGKNKISNYQRHMLADHVDQWFDEKNLKDAYQQAIECEQR